MTVWKGLRNCFTTNVFVSLTILCTVTPSLRPTRAVEREDSYYPESEQNTYKEVMEWFYLLKLVKKAKEHGGGCIDHAFFVAQEMRKINMQATICKTRNYFHFFVKNDRWTIIDTYPEGLFDDLPDFILQEKTEYAPYTHYYCNPIELSPAGEEVLRDNIYLALKWQIFRRDLQKLRNKDIDSIL